MLIISVRASKSSGSLKKRQGREKGKKTSQSHLIVTHIPFMTWKCGRAVKISPPCIKFPPIIMIMLISAVVSQWDHSLFEVLSSHAMVSRFHKSMMNSCNGFMNSRNFPTIIMIMQLSAVVTQWDDCLFEVLSKWK